MGIKLTDSQLKAVDEIVENSPWFVTASALLITGIAQTKEEAVFMLH